MTDNLHTARTNTVEVIMSSDKLIKIKFTISIILYYVIGDFTTTTAGGAMANFTMATRGFQVMVQ